MRRILESFRSIISSSPSEIARRYVNFVTLVIVVTLLIVFLPAKGSSSSSSQGLAKSGVAIAGLCMPINNKKRKRQFNFQKTKDSSRGTRIIEPVYIHHQDRDHLSNLDNSVKIKFPDHYISLTRSR